MLRLALLLVIFCALGAPALAADIPDVSDADLEQSLALAGANRAELSQALFACQQKPYTLQAMRFTIAGLPLADLGVAKGAALLENVELAMEARGEFPYSTGGAGYDDATWAHYVLPPRISQEPLSPWRSYLFGELKEVVRDCKTLEAATVKVNEWCGARVRFQQTQTRDQGPLVTLRSGYGRCEEEVIIFVSACRAVGIPARQAYCPYWAIMDNNHAWAEVLGSDGRWHFTGACEPRPTLDDAWFGDAVKQAPLIVSVCYGGPGATGLSGGALTVNELGEEVLSMKSAPGARYCLINNTASYRPTGMLTVEGPASSTAEPQFLTLSVFNFGALRQIAKLEFSPGGRAAVSLGAGTYMLSVGSAGSQSRWDAPGGSAPAAAGGKPEVALATVRTNVETRLDIREQGAVPGSFILEYPRD